MFDFSLSVLAAGSGGLHRFAHTCGGRAVQFVAFVPVRAASIASFSAPPPKMTNAPHVAFNIRFPTALFAPFVRWNMY